MGIIFESKHIDVHLVLDEAEELWKITRENEITALGNIPYNCPRYEVHSNTPEYFFEQLDFMLNTGWKLHYISHNALVLLKEKDRALFEKINDNIREKINHATDNI